MSWRVEWKAISDRIAGLLDSCRFYLESKAIRSDDPYSVAKNQLLPQAEAIFKLLEQFHLGHASMLPSQASTCLNKFVQQFRSHFSDSTMDSQAAVQFRMTTLASLRSEFNYHVTDFAVFAKRLSEKAFEHLQRSIVADSTERDKWQRGFKQGEVACEKLGAAHFLLHGIWAFKINAEGERTDLIFNEPIRETYSIERSADALVLTEWKIVHSHSEVSRKVGEAKSQTKRYTHGALAGLELAQYRYLVILSNKMLPMPADDSDGDLIYRHINIAVDPDSPSQK